MMNKISSTLALTFLAACSSARSADQTGWKVAIELKDGSRIVGSPSFPSIRLKTPKAEREILLRQIVTANRSDGTWTVSTEQGTDISGAMLTQSLNVTTLIGPLKLPMRHVVSLDVFPTDLGISVPRREDLVLYLNFDRHSGTRSRNLASFGHHAVVHGAKWTPKGKRGGAYEFDGKASLQIPHHADLCPKAFTLAAWVYPQDGDGLWRLLITKTNDSSWYGGYGFYRYYGDKRNLYFYVGNYSSSAAKAAIPQGEWIHIAGTFDGKEVTLYVNGEPSRPVKRAAGGVVMNQVKTPFVIGGSGSYHWNGKVDEVMLYRRALSAKDIEKLMIATTPSKNAKNDENK